MEISFYVLVAFKITDNSLIPATKFCLAAQMGSLGEGL